MLVDMAGSENIEQAGQIGFEAKMQVTSFPFHFFLLVRVLEFSANDHAFNVSVDCKDQSRKYSTKKGG